MQNVSVVLMNWQRPGNVESLVEKYVREPRVNHVIVWDASPLSPVNLQHRYANLTYIRAYHDLGLYARYAAAALAISDPVLIVDDDIELRSETIANLYYCWERRPKVLHGIFGRNPSIAEGYYNVGQYIDGECQVVLTRAVMTTRALCATALLWGIQHCDELPGQPRGNGEDIVLSHVAMAESEDFNRAYPKLWYRNLHHDDQHAISVRVKNHEEHRTAMVNWCRKNIKDWWRLTRKSMVAQ